VDGPLTPPALPERVTVREVGPRDGLQAERPLSVEDRIRLIDALSRTGVRKIEAVSFVSPEVVPAMARAAEVWAGVDRVPGIAYSALVPNRRGAEAAAEAGGFASLQAFLAVSEGYNRANLGKPVAESFGDVAEVMAAGLDAGIPVEVSISAAFGDPYEGEVAPERVLDLAQRLVEAGAAGISLGDTIGMATPTRVWDVVTGFRARLPATPLNLHLHDSRGTAMANALAALQAGVIELDASIGGLGGSPFAPGAGGTLATEDLVGMLEDMGIHTGVHLDRAEAAARLAGELVGHPVPGRRSAPAHRLA
jgi:hydroxymethylglutaryl-CoA lyase